MDLRALPFAQLNSIPPLKKKGLSVFLSFRRSCLHLTFVRDDLSYLLVSLNLGFLSFLDIYVQNSFHPEGGRGIDPGTSV